MRTLSLLFIAILCGCQRPASVAQKEQLQIVDKNLPAEKVNVFLGSSGDHGQLSPAASYPFSMLSIGPQTYPSTHTGYEHLAKQFLGFTHNRFEGVGCLGSGGNILVKPFLGDAPDSTQLIKAEEEAGPGYYKVGFGNKIKAAFAVYKNNGIHHYQFPAGRKGIYIDLSHAFVGRFVAEEHAITGNAVSGWIEAQTTCSVGTYRLYYAMQFRQPVKWTTVKEHELIASLDANQAEAYVEVAFSSVDVAHASAALSNASFEEMKQKSSGDWNQLLGRIQVKGNPERENLFYSLLYRAVQSPYVVSEEDGKYRAIDGSLQTSKNPIYNGWAIWDNYKTQLPLLSFAYPERFQDIASSIANLYPYGKRDFATAHEPSNTVRTEHALVVLLDAYRKGYKIDFPSILDSLIQEVDRLDYTHPDKALESSYDAWALSQILDELAQEQLSEKYKQKALKYKDYWEKDFKDLTRDDVNSMSARGMYQGTIWQYRWSVPFDVEGLIELTGGEQAFLNQLDEFFGKDYHNRANEPDLQVPLLYNATSVPWKSQALMHQLAVDTVVQHYFNDNSRGIGSYVGVLYKNQPEAYLRTMDDDAGAMSSWFVLASLGMQPACVGWPVYYLNVPLFESAEIKWPNGKAFTVQVENYADTNPYIKQVTLNGKNLERNWLTQEEVMTGGRLIITASDKPEKSWEVENRWIPSLDASR
ncbi:glycoside hydrolase domain-containing protein [Pontibacter silvestris]|uniref:Glycoside hydrolase domain-containing protein n=1 Tax=Pontibacter silvestris TaxID=2305183 RepID=A0ABW4X1N7_9BACT|nr:glycoside hydrolase domain-containing protein [Pontibacter silvestris]MCC9138675.1 glycoside hydrolase family 92 protein [Pontibacter silvestris]